MTNGELEAAITAKMRGAGVGSATIHAFLDAHRRVKAGERGLIPETAIQPVGDLPRLDQLPGGSDDAAPLMREMVVFKLNGGLGTGMGLDRAKSLLPIRDGATFLDFIARQILHLREGTGGSAPRFVLMNSFTTRDDTLEFLARYPALVTAGPVDFLQNKVPKLWADTFEPVEWPEEPELEWCPPGHGDFYPALLNSGLLDNLLDQGVRYAFVSNSDNLGATVDSRMLRYFAETGLSFLMEVAERTGADRKGGHLARRVGDGRLLLRESAQCGGEDEAAFQDIARHRFFNTNNLWIRLDHLAAALRDPARSIRLPLITNSKTVDPKNPATRKVLQLESAMGAAIEAFERTGAVVVPRSRFSPVKSTSDLVVLRSDAYQTTPDHRLVLAPGRNGRPPVVDLDPRHYRLLAGFEALFPTEAPSLIRCDTLKVEGPVRFDSGVVCEGDVSFRNASAEIRAVQPGLYRNRSVEVG